MHQIVRGRLSCLKLNRGERSILANFEDGPAAEQAVAALKQAGYTDVGLDRVDGFPGGRNPDDDTRPGIGEASEVTAILAGNSTMLDDDARVLMNAMPEASGMAGTPTQIVPPFLVTVVTDEQGLDRAVGIIKRHGGRV